MEECIFCKVINEGLQDRLIHESEKYLAILDAYPLAVGHTLIITKEHHSHVWDVPECGEYFEFAKEVSEHLTNNLGVDRVDVLVSGGTVPHAHIHLIPQSEGEWTKVKDYLRSLRKALQKTSTAELASKLRF